MSAELYTDKWHAGKIAVVMVGLPATGKTFTARNLVRHLRWLGVRTRMFSVAQYRNRVLDGEHLTADFFDPNNEDFLAKRTMIANMALKDMICWLEDGEGGGQVAILDASNTRLERRKIIRQACATHGIKVFLLECLGSGGHELAVSEHVRELRLTCPEYANLSNEQAIADFTRRIQYYRPHYLPVGAEQSEKGVPYVRLLEGGKQIVANNVTGYLPTRMLYYLMNLHHGSKRIFLYPLPSHTAHLEAHLLPAQQYLALHDAHIFSVWTETSWMGARLGQIFAKQTFLTRPQLRALDSGVVEHLGLEQIKQQYPDQYERHMADPYHHRYPRAESYHDLAVRLETVMMELEREPNDTLILADRTVLQCIYAYFTDVPNSEIPGIVIEPCSLLELRPKAYGVFERRINLDEGIKSPGSDLFRPFRESP